MDRKSALLGHALVLGIDREKLRRLWGMPQATYCRRLADPDRITLAEFRRYCQITNLDDKEIADFVRSK